MDCDKKDVASVEQSLNTLISNTSHIKMDTYHAQLQYAEYTSRMMKLGCYLFMAIVGLIGFMNLANTMIINITTKKQEYGVLQAIGMTNKQLNLSLQIWNAAMQHLLLSQCHQKFPYPQRNGYNPFPMALGVALNNLPGCAAAGTADGQFTSTGYVPPLQSTQFPTPQSGRDCQCVVRPIQNCFVLNKHFFK